MESKHFGVIGHPITHSLSPIMHEAAFKKLGLPHTYKRFDVPDAWVSDFLEKDVLEKRLSGINVTIPHKQKVMPLLDKLSREAEVIGAVNTITFGGKTVGYNTDGIGFVRNLEENKVSVKDNTFLVLGTGGAGRAITFQLTLEGGYVTIADKMTDRAGDLRDSVLDKLGVDIPIIECNPKSIVEALEGIEVLVNATPVGMHPNVNASVVSAESIPDNTVVADIVYNPLETKLRREAKARGLKTVSGVGMLVHQGAEALRIWLGVEPPIKEMTEAVAGALGETG